MEQFLACYLENFNQLPRNSLHDRRKRSNMVNYISTLIKGCSGQGCDTETTATQAIITIIRYHEKQRQENSSICVMGKYHNILYVALKLCYIFNVKHSETVAMLLQQIYGCEETFERLLVGALFGTRAPHYIAGWKSDFDNQQENLDAVIFFLHHANNAHLRLRWKDEELRFVDVPIESCGRSSPLKIAVQLGLPDKLLIFLKFGALIDCGQDNDNVSIPEHILNRLLEFNHLYPFNLVNCLQLLLRVLPSIVISPEKYSELIEDGLLPPNRIGLSPPELKHICRCLIRRRLHENFLLPAGIQELPIPPALFQYLDIMED